MKKELTVFALAAVLSSLPAFAEQDEATEPRQLIKLTEQQLDEVGLGLAIRGGHVRPALGPGMVKIVNTTPATIDLDNYQTPPKDPCDWSWVYCSSACEQNWWVYCTEGQ
jgi:hypothetical protein